MNIPQPVKATYSSHVTSVFLMLFILFLIWLSNSGRLKSLMGVFNSSSLSEDDKTIGKITGSGASSSGVSANESSIRKALRAAGFDQSGVDTMIAIGKAESGLRTNATLSTSREYSVGPFQINLKAHPYVSEEDARNPSTAAKFAYILSGGGKNFRPWTTYTSGKYRKYLK